MLITLKSGQMTRERRMGCQPTIGSAEPANRRNHYNALSGFE